MDPKPTDDIERGSKHITDIVEQIDDIMRYAAEETDVSVMQDASIKNDDDEDADDDKDADEDVGDGINIIAKTIDTPPNGTLMDETESSSMTGDAIQSEVAKKSVTYGHDNVAVRKKSISGGSSVGTTTINGTPVRYVKEVQMPCLTVWTCVTIAIFIGLLALISNEDETKPALEEPIVPTSTKSEPSGRVFTNASELTDAIDEHMAMNGTSNVSIGEWDVSAIDDFSSLFSAARNEAMIDFNDDIGMWDTSSAVNMSSLFYGAAAFNGNLSYWNVSSVTDMSNMFKNASSFEGTGLDQWVSASLFRVSHSRVPTFRLYGVTVAI